MATDPLDDPLDDFAVTSETHHGTTKTVYRKGEGPGVVVMSEIPGITPKVADFARRVVDEGFTVTMPVLFGTPGRKRSGGYIVSSLVRSCVSSEFTALATGKTSPVTMWLRAHAAALHAQAGGAGVGAVGMCLTGGFALAMMVDEVIQAPVLSQPSLPLAIGGKRAADLGVDRADLDRAAQRVADGCPVLGLRFTADRAVGDRFATLREALGDGFVAVEIDSHPGNAHGLARSAHSVLTEELVDEPGHPTRDALDRVLGLFHDRLR